MKFERAYKRTNHAYSWITLTSMPSLVFKCRIGYRHMPNTVSENYSGQRRPNRFKATKDRFDWRIQIAFKHIQLYMKHSSTIHRTSNSLKYFKLP